jgi:hypothetical protein
MEFETLKDKHTRKHAPTHNKYEIMELQRENNNIGYFSIPSLADIPFL